MQPLVSIVIPTYNRAHLIGETLESVLAQTFQNWECIVVDDDSTDHTDELLEFYTEKDFRITYYHRPKDRPKGANACRNYGFEMSKGEYINWFDSDDLMLKRKLSEQLKVLKKNLSLDLCICEYGLYDENLQLISRKSFTTSNLLEDYIIGKAFFNLQTTIFKKNTLFKIPLDENIFKAQEMEFFFRYFLQKSVKYELLSKEFVKVRLHNRNITSSFNAGDKKAITSEMNVRLIGLQILKDTSSEENLRLALNHYMIFLKNILIQRKLKLYFHYLYELKNILPLRENSRLLKLMLIAGIFWLTGKDLYYFRSEFVFK